LLRRRFAAGVVAAPALWAASRPVWAQTPAAAAGAISRASYLQALSQRMTKAYVQLGLGIERADAQQVLQSSAREFERSIAQLRGLTAAPDIRHTYDLLGAAWKRAQPVVAAAAPTPDSVAKLLNMDTELLQLANTGTWQFQQASRLAGAEWINLAGRQRMLSQRIAKWQFCRVWGVAVRVADQDLPRSRQEFLAAMTRLNQQSRTPQQKDAMRAAELQWVFFDAAIGPGWGGGSPDAQRKLAGASEVILAAFNEVTAAFERGAVA
jgi:hypothetical protein